MTKLLSVVLLVGLLAVHAIDPQTSVAKKFIDMVTNFLTELQVEQVSDAVIEKVCVFADTQDITEAAMSKAMDVLEGSQYVSGMNLYSKAMKTFGNMSAINDTIQLCVGGASPIVMPLYTTLYKDKLEPKKGASTDELKAIVYKFVDSKFKLKFVKKIAKACVSKLSKDQVTKAKTVLNGIVNFQKLNI